MGQEHLTESEPPPARAIVQIQGRDSGPPLITVTVHADDVAEAARLAREQYDALLRQYVTSTNGTHAPLAALVPVDAPVVAPTPADPPLTPADVLPAPAAAPPEEPVRRVRPGLPRVRLGVPRVDLAGTLLWLRSSVDRDMLTLGAAGALVSWLAWMVIYAHGNQPLVWDARQYYVMALELNQTGPGGWVNPLRTYAYPFFLAAFVATLGDNAIRVQYAVSFVQWLVNLGVAVAAGLAFARVAGSRWRGLLVFGLIALNPFLIAQTTSLLSDSLSASTIMLAVIPLMVAWQRGLGERSVGWLMAASLFCASLAAEVRPANAIIIPVLGVLWLVRMGWFRSLPWRWLPLVLVGFILPLVPQMLANQRGYGTLYPLTVSSSLYEQSLQYGMTLLKSRTSTVPDKPAEMYYQNPFYVPTARMPSEFLAQAPAGYLATLSIHGFALVDVDLPYTYVFDYHPWYRWPLSIMGYLFWLLAVVGAATAVARVVRQRAIEPLTWGVLASAVVGLVYLAIHLPVAPDIRYGLPLYLLAVPAVGVGVERVRGSARQSRRRAYGWLAATLIVVAACASLSAWISLQAPSLRG